MVGIKDVAPDLLMPEGCLTRAAPDAARQCRYREGARGAARAQSVRHRSGRRRDRRPCGRRSRTSRAPTACWRGWRGCASEGRIRAKAGRGVLVKAPKSGQDLRFDLPTRRPAHHRGRGRGRACRHRRRRRQHHRRRAAGHDRGRRQGRPVRHGSARVMPARASADVARKIFLIATEESGDRLGASLMKVLRQRLGGAVRFEGVGGRAHGARGADVAVSDRGTVDHRALPRWSQQLPMILRRDPRNRRRGDRRPRPTFW